LNDKVIDTVKDIVLNYDDRDVAIKL